MGFFTSIEFAFVETVALAASNRREAVLGLAFSEPSDCSGMTTDGFTDPRVSQAVIGVKETSRTCEFSRFVGTCREHRVQLGSFIGRQIDRILLISWHELLQKLCEYSIEAL